VSRAKAAPGRPALPREDTRATVAPITEMTLQRFRLHLRSRHPTLRYGQGRAAQEEGHAWDHRTRPEIQDHVHSEEEQ